MQSYKVYYRVSDLAPVYENVIQVFSTWSKLYESWQEYLNGGMVEYEGEFTESDFHIPKCDYSFAAKARFLDWLNFHLTF